MRVLLHLRAVCMCMYLNFVVNFRRANVGQRCCQRHRAKCRLCRLCEVCHRSVYDHSFESRLMADNSERRSLSLRLNSAILLLKQGEARERNRINRMYGWGSGSANDPDLL